MESNQADPEEVQHCPKDSLRDLLGTRPKNYIEKAVKLEDKIVYNVNQY